MPNQELTAYERSARITYLLLSVGVAMTTAEVAKVAGLARQNAYALLCAISRVAPIYQDEQRIWRKYERVT